MAMQKENRQTRPAKGVYLAIAVLCLCLAGAGISAFAAVIFLLGTGTPVWDGPFALSAAVAINLAWVVVFGLQHSGMARTPFKRWWTRFIPADLERFVYSGVSGALSLLLLVLWQPLPGEPLWQLPPAFAAVALLAAAAMGISMLWLDPASFISLCQLRRPGLTGQRDQLRIVGPYRWIRHPQMACALLFLWGWPVMSPTLALLSGGLTAYILLALPLEEHDLVVRFGRHYLDYRRRVPMLLPWRPPVRRAVVDEGTA